MTRIAILVLVAGCATDPSHGSPAPGGGGKADGDSTTMLDCNTSVGPDQQVTVTTDGSSYTLVELTTSGSEVDRTLDASEWAAESFMLRDDFGSTTTFSKMDGQWVVQSDSSYGYADCWTDKSE